jgi:hypothetical protein
MYIVKTYEEFYVTNLKTGSKKLKAYHTKYTVVNTEQGLKIKGDFDEEKVLDQKIE